MLKLYLHVNFGRINKYIFRKDFRKNASENKANTNDGTIYADKKQYPDAFCSIVWVTFMKCFMMMQLKDLKF